MPWIAVVCLCLIGACSFEADYTTGSYTCRDGKCPAPLVCDTEQDTPRCIEPRNDAAVDDALPDDAIPDGPPPALTCAVPGVLSTSGGFVEGNTAGGTNMISSLCNGISMLGVDDVYKLDIGPGKQVLLTISTIGPSWSATAYIVQPCGASACVGNTYAVPGAPATTTTLAGGPAFVIVDSNLAAHSGAYRLDYAITN